MSFKAFSEKQLDALSWWSPKRKTSSYDGIICDGAVRSGKTLCMSVSFISWAMFSFDGGSFAICGKTIRSVKRNVASPLLNILRELGFLFRKSFHQISLLFIPAKEKILSIFSVDVMKARRLLYRALLSAAYFLMRRLLCRGHSSNRLLQDVLLKALSCGSTVILNILSTGFAESG